MTWQSFVTWPCATQGSSDPLHHGGPGPPSSSSSHGGTPLDVGKLIKDLNNRAAFRARDEGEGARPQVAGEAWLRVEECSNEIPSSGASDGLADRLAAQLATSIRIPQESNTRKRAGSPAQPEFSKRFFTAPMVGGAHLDPKP